MFSSSPQTSASQKAFFIPRVYGETTAAHCCEMSRHISRAWQGSSPPLGRRAAQLSLVSATVVEAVDRSRDRQTHVPSKTQEGGPSCFQRGHYRRSVSPPLSVVWGGVVSRSPPGPSWNCHSQPIETIFLWCTHTQRFLHSHAQDSNRCRQILYTERRSSRLDGTEL